MSAAAPLLAVDGLRVRFQTEEGVVQAVDGVSFTVAAGEVVAIVGESGSGKSVTSMTLMGLTRSPNASFEGTAMFDGVELISASEAQLRRIRGARIAMIFQDPISSLDPVHRIGDQIAEQIRVHDRSVSKSAARHRAIQLMERVGIPRARERARSYPHEFSGGMRQRVMIAMALSCSPNLLIADEPTTALDVTIQAQILDELRELRDTSGTGIIIVTHDLGVVADIADRLIVMYAGRVVEQGTLDELFYDPQHPYTWGLLGSMMRIDGDRSRQLPAIPGTPPSLMRPPAGCHFRPRCPHAFERCTQVPPLAASVADAPGHLDRCWLDPEEKARRRLVDARARDGAERDHARRAGLGARRVDPGAGDQPARPPPEAARPDARVRRPRPVGGAARLDAHRRHVPRQDRRDLAGGGALREADPPVHAGAAGLDPDPRPAREPGPPAHEDRG
jgi:oligopeptide/dipeptide ABC transporter ATP-binding protein